MKIIAYRCISKPYKEETLVYLMKIGELLAELEGLKKGDIYYWEKMHYINPQKIQKDRISRREFGHKDFMMIRKMWKLYQRGLRPKLAYKQAKKELQEHPSELLENSLDNPTHLKEFVRNLNDLVCKAFENDTELSFKELCDRLHALKTNGNHNYLFNEISTVLPIEETKPEVYRLKKR